MEITTKKILQLSEEMNVLLTSYMYLYQNGDKRISVENLLVPVTSALNSLEGVVDTLANTVGSNTQSINALASAQQSTANNVNSINQLISQINNQIADINNQIAGITAALEGIDANAANIEELFDRVPSARVEIPTNNIIDWESGDSFFGSFSGGVHQITFSNVKQGSCITIELDLTGGAVIELPSSVVMEFGDQIADTKNVVALKSVDGETGQHAVWVQEET